MSAGINVEFNERGHGPLVDALNRVGEYAERAGDRVDRMTAAQRRAEEQANRTRNSFGILNDTLGRSASSFGILEGVVAGLASSLAIGSLVRYTDTYGDLENRLRLVTKTQADTNKAMEATYGIANNTRTSWESIVPVYSRVVDGIKRMSGASYDANKITTTLAQSVALGGSSAASAKAGMYQFQQALASGVLRGEEFNSVMENTPGLARALALGVDGANGSLGKLRQMAQNGALTTSVLIKALDKVAPTISKAFAQFTPSISQSFGVLENSVIRYVGSTDRAMGVSKLFSGAILLIADNINIVIPVLAAFAAMLGVVAVTLLTIKFIEAINMIRILGSTIVSTIPIIATWAASMVAALIPLGLIALKVGLVTLAIGAIAAALTIGGTALYSFIEYFSGAGTVVDLFSTAINWLYTQVQTLGRGFYNIGMAVMDWYNKSIIAQEVANLIGLAFNTLWGVLVRVGQGFYNISMAVINWITQNQTLNNIVTNAIGIWNIFTANLEKLYNWITGLVTKFAEWVGKLDIVNKTMAMAGTVASKLGIDIGKATDLTKLFNVSLDGLGNISDDVAKKMGGLSKELSGYEYGAKLAIEATEKYVEKQNKLNEMLGTGITAKYDADLNKVVYTTNIAKTSTDSLSNSMAGLNDNLSNATGAIELVANQWGQYVEKANSAISANSSLANSFNSVSSAASSASSAASSVGSSSGYAPPSERENTVIGQLGDIGGSSSGELGGVEIMQPSLVEYDGVVLAQALPTGDSGAYQDSYRAITEWKNYMALLDNQGQATNAYIAQQALQNIIGKYPSLRFSYQFAELPYIQENTTGFNTGGSFTVGGIPGIDKNVVPLRLTKGEQVNVWTPRQKRNIEDNDNQNATRGGDVFNFEFPNTDRDAFRRTDRQHLQTFARKMRSAAR